MNDRRPEAQPRSLPGLVGVAQGAHVVEGLGETPFRFPRYVVVRVALRVGVAVQVEVAEGVARRQLLKCRRGLLANHAHLGEGSADLLWDVEEYLMTVGGTIVASRDADDLPHLALSAPFEVVEAAAALVEQHPAELVRLPRHLVGGHIRGVVLESEEHGLHHWLRHGVIIEGQQGTEFGPLLRPGELVLQILSEH